MLDKSSPLGRRICLCLIVLLAAGLRFYHLGRQNFWLDEIVHVQIASQAPADIVRNYRPHVDRLRRDQAPLSFLALHPFLSSRHPEWSARLPSALFGIADVVAVYFVGCELFPHPIALVAALLLAVSPIHIWYSQEARWYAQWSLLTTLSYLALIRVWRRASRAAWVGYALLVLCGIYTFIFSFLVMVCHTASVWWLSRSRNGSRRVLVTFLGIQLAVVIASTPVLMVVTSEIGSPTGTPRLTEPAVLAYTLYAYAAGFTLGPTVAYLHTLPNLMQLATDYPIVVVVLCAWLLLLIGGARAIWLTPTAAVVIPWLFGPPLLVFLLGKLTHVTYQVRYSFESVPAAALLAAVAIWELPTAVWRGAATGALLSCAAASLVNLYGSPRYGKEDVRGALAHVRAARLADATTIAVGEIDIAVAHYRDGLTMAAGGCPPPAGPARGVTELSNTVWVVAGRDWTDQAGHCLDALASTYETVDHHRFTGVDLWLLQRRNRLP